jgi:hypothetical protein
MIEEELPEKFECKFKTPYDEEEKIEVTGEMTTDEAKRKICRKFEFPADEIKLLFNGEEISVDETFFELTLKGYTPASQLEIVFINPFKVTIELFNGMKFDIETTPHSFIWRLRYIAAQQGNVDWALTHLTIDGEIVGADRTLDFHGIREGMFLKQVLTPLSELFLNKSSLTTSSFPPMIEYVDGMEECYLYRLKALPLMKTIKELLELNKSNEEMTVCIASLVLSVAWRGFDGVFLQNNLFEESGREIGLLEYLERELEEMFDENEKKKEKKQIPFEDDFVQSYVLISADKPLKKKLFVPIIEKCLWGIGELKQKKGNEKIRHFCLCFGCLVGTPGFSFLFSFFLFILHISLV